MTWKLCRREPFSYWRFGDGFIELLMGKKGGTCDGEKYTANLAAVLGDAVCRLVDRESKRTFFGDWQSASFSGPRDPARYEAEYQKMFSAVAESQWLHFEALLFMRASKPLADFYQALRDDPREKAFFGPVGNHAVAESLGCKCIATPMEGLLHKTEVLQQEVYCIEPDILLFGAGMAGNLAAIGYYDDHPTATVINLGSALDVLGRGRSRKQQIPEARARAVFEGRV